ncbi:MAG: DUF2235 domain-containing protein [Armatimonadetes bacterium]|nr:DUF2235 domain-containing protein [Armatimonadota bacterium]
MLFVPLKWWLGNIPWGNGKLGDHSLLMVPLDVVGTISIWLLALVIVVAVIDKKKESMAEEGLKERARVKAEKQNGESKAAVASKGSTALASTVEAGAKRRIILCIDGTNDFAATLPTHVYRFYSNLKSNDDQLVYYDGGVGSLKDTTALSSFGQEFGTAWDLAFGTSLRRNVLSAYEFLMENYRGDDKDEIYLFGFSRGAYACRVLAGMLKAFGILPKGHENLAPFVWQSYCELSQGGGYDAVWLMKCSMHIHQVQIAYLGAWDTVSSVGIIRQRTFRYTRSLPNVAEGRHAVSIDEHRNMFPENPIDPDSKVQEVWFAGNHRGVGGGDKASVELSLIAYNWVTEGVKGKLEFYENHCNFKPPVPSDASVKEKPMNDYGVVAQYIFLAGFVPQRIFTDFCGCMGNRWHWFRLWHVRKPENANIHESVVDRIKVHNGAYFPNAVFSGNASNFQPKNGNKVVP